MGGSQIRLKFSVAVDPEKLLTWVAQPTGGLPVSNGSGPAAGTGYENSMNCRLLVGDTAPPPSARDPAGHSRYLPFSVLKSSVLETTVALEVAEQTA